jgi:Reverse transcriptase (RNA-dependent DNA polymerase).
MEIVGGVREGCCMSPILFNLYGKYLMMGALAEIQDFKIGGRIISKLRFADDTAITANTQEELQDKRCICQWKKLSVTWK